MNRFHMLMRVPRLRNWPSPALRLCSPFSITTRPRVRTVSTLRPRGQIKVRVPFSHDHLPDVDATSKQLRKHTSYSLPERSLPGIPENRVQHHKAKDKGEGTDTSRANGIHAAFASAISTASPSDSRYVAGLVGVAGVAGMDVVIHRPYGAKRQSSSATGVSYGSSSAVMVFRRRWRSRNGR